VVLETTKVEVQKVFVEDFLIYALLAHANLAAEAEVDVVHSALQRRQKVRQVLPVVAKEDLDSLIVSVSPQTWVWVLV
jgi:hypothetical protein